ncbi:hypothetical protein GCM10009681_32960 [Luedemannella helvata]|uniref:NACHT domain-containing protein n=2 Tax=Luedemannella helvata TaxID=349315 RepID=A0ABN2KMX1_9ACTN
MVLRQLHYEDIAMETYVADNRRPVDRCLRDVAACDLYIGIFAYRYGYVPRGATMSITEMEYREAQRLRKPCLIFLLDDDAPWPPRWVDRGENLERMLALRQHLQETHVCDFFTGPDSLAHQVSVALTNWHNDTGTAAPGREALSQDSLDRYLARLKAHCAGVDVELLRPAVHPDVRQANLAAVFVEPTVRENQHRVEIPREWRRRLPEAGDASWVPADVGDVQRLWQALHAGPERRLFDVLTERGQRTVVLLGDPGSGKSTIARYLMGALAGTTTDRRLSALAEHLPVLLELRSYVAMMRAGRCQSFLDYLDVEAGGNGPGLAREVLEPYLRAGHRALVVFDGLDEVPRQDLLRAGVARQIAGFAAEYPQVRVIVTSRGVGYAATSLGDFAHFTLQDLDGAQIGDFLRRWTAEVRRRAPEVSQVNRMVAALSGSATMRELSGNPLLLTILALDGDGQPPRGRWQLCQHAVSVLVKRWDGIPRANDDPLAFLTATDHLRLLRNLAFRAVTGQLSVADNVISQEDLCGAFEEYLSPKFIQEPDRARLLASRLVDEFRERHFILSRFGDEHVGFVHRTFLEFFVADAIVHRHAEGTFTATDLADLYRAHCADAAWHEILRLIAAHPGVDVGPLLTVLTSRADRPWPPAEFDEPPTHLALAVQCLAEVADLSTVAEPATALLRQVILLLEHGVTIDDRATDLMVEGELLPAAALIGAEWPGRKEYLRWYRRRGSAIVSAPMSSHAARLAAMLADEYDGVVSLLDQLGRPRVPLAAALASVAGIEELARVGLRDAGEAVAGGGDPAGGPDQSAQQTVARPSAAAMQQVNQAEDLLARRVAEDRPAPVRRAATEAMVTTLAGRDSVAELMLIRAREDANPDIRSSVLRGLADWFHADARWLELIIDRARTDPAPAVRRVATELLDHAGHEPEWALVERLVSADVDAGVVREAVRMADRQGGLDRIRLALIARATTDSDELVRRAAVRLLGERYPAGAVCDTLAERARVDRDAGVRRAAVQALADVGGPTALLRDVLRHQLGEDADTGTRVAALRAYVTAFPAEPDTTALLIERVRAAHDPRVRTEAVRLLVERGTDMADVAALLTVRVEREAVAETRQVVLTELLPLISGDARRDLLLRVVDNDGDAKVRAIALTALVPAVEADAAVRQRMLDRARNDQDAQIRLIAVRSLCTVAADVPAVRTLLRERIRVERDVTVFEELTEALLALPGRPHVALKSRLTRDDPPGVRRCAVRALARLPVGEDIRTQLAAQARTDLDVDVVAEAVEGLVTRFGPGPLVRDVLVERAADGERPMRALAMRCLGTHFGGEADVARLLRERAESDRDIQVRLAAMRALCDRPAPGPAVRDVLVTLTEHTDRRVSVAAVRLLGSLFGRDDVARRVIANRAARAGSADLRAAAGQVLTWLPDASPADLPDISQR